MVTNLPNSRNQRVYPAHEAERGQGLIEALIGFGIIIILFHALASLIIAAYDLLGNARTRTTARHIANAHMEEIRNMPYESIGIIGGIPPGDLNQQKTVTTNGIQYTIRKTVVYIDDPFDGLAPSDSDPSDYKRARVEVSWGGRFTAGDAVILVTDIAAQETVGGGLLSILVFDSNALPVLQANVHILNTLVNPQIDVTLQTDDQGRASLPGASACNTCYQITVTKTGFSTDRTYGTEEVANPLKPHATLIEEQITQVSFSIDRTSALNIASSMDRANNFAPLTNKAFRLTGSKTIGTDNLTMPIYKYDQLLQTDATGNLILQDTEWDSYTLSLDPDSWDLTGSNPLNPIAILPNSNLNILFASSNHVDDTLLLSVTDATGSAIASASAQLTGPGGYDETLFTGEQNFPDFGQAFFSPLSPGSHTVSVSKTGYLPATEIFDVSGQTDYTVPLTPL